MFPHQRDLVNWALKRGRCAIFAATGLGKTIIQLSWADTIHKELGGKILILCPLAISQQTVQEGVNFGINVNYVKENEEIKDGINITNYDRLHLFDCSQFIAVVLDESSIIKNFQSKTLKILLSEFSKTPYKLCCTATPSPNDFTELGTHAEFLEIRSHSEMLAEFFINDMKLANKWRLKGHCKYIFWKWVSSWGALIRNPSELGYDGSTYDLPQLNVIQHVIKTIPKEGQIFANQSSTLMDRKRARRESINERVNICADMINNVGGTWLVWCELNSESELLTKLIDGAVEVKGSHKPEIKEERLLGFCHGDVKILVSKPKIAGFGLNMQRCHNMAFVGVTDSFESYYQSVRRCWRFGQKEQVNVHVFSADTEGAVVDNLKIKEKNAKLMADELSSMLSESIQMEILGTRKESNSYIPENQIELPVF